MSGFEFVVTDAERKLLEETARTLIRVQETLDGIHSVLRAIYLANGNSRLALARLRIERDLARLRGRRCAYVDAFVQSIERNQATKTDREAACGK